MIDILWSVAEMSIFDTSWANPEGNNISADDLLRRLEEIQQSIRQRDPFEKLGIKADDCIAMHPSMMQHFYTLTKADENPIGFSKEAGYIHKFSGIPVLTIEEIEFGICEIGAYEAFCVKYPEWYKRELEARKLLEEARQEIEKREASDNE
jgi:hypothetical protein